MERKLQLTIHNLSASVGAIAGVIALFVIVEPHTPHYLGYLRIPSIILLSLILLTCIFTLIHRHFASIDSAFRKLLAPTKSSIMIWIMLLSSAVGCLIYIWQPPSKPQIARQILNTRGMLLSREHYLTSLEIGDWTAIQLFHDAGFDSESAFAWLGGSAVTHPDRLSVQVLLERTTPSALRNTIRAFANSEPQPFSGAEELDLIDRPIRVPLESSHEIFASILPREPRHLQDMLANDGLPLLGYAILWEQRDSVNTLLNLGAKLRPATMPLLRLGVLPADFELLAVDPFLYVLNFESTVDSLDTLTDYNRAAPLVAMLRNQGYSPSRFADPEKEPSGFCTDHGLSEIGPSAKYSRFIGYRVTAGEYQLVDFEITSCISTSHTSQADGTLHYTDTSSRMDGAVLRTVGPVDSGDESGYYAWLTTSVSQPTKTGPWTHYAGAYSPTVKLFTATRADVLSQSEAHIVIIAPDRPDVTTETITSYLYQAENARGDPIVCTDLGQEEPIHRWQLRPLHCDVRAKVSLSVKSDGHVPYFVAMNHGSNPLYVIITEETSSILLSPGDHTIVVAPLTPVDAIEVSIDFAPLRPVFTPDINTTYVADWPSDEITISDSIPAGDRHVAYVQVTNVISGTVVLSPEQEGFDLRLACVTPRPGCRRSQLSLLSDTPASADDAYFKNESFADSIVWPGTYRLEIKTTDRKRDYTIVMSSDEPEVHSLTAADGVAELRDTTIEYSDDSLSLESIIEFVLAESSRAVITLMPESSDLDLRLIGSDGVQIDTSENFGTDPDVISRRLVAGTYYVMVYAVESPSKFAIRVVVGDGGDASS